MSSLCTFPLVLGPEDLLFVFKNFSFTCKSVILSELIFVCYET